jgi:hypothetical protein
MIVMRVSVAPGQRPQAPVLLQEESIQKRRRFIRDADDLVRCLTVEFETEFGFRFAVFPVRKMLELSPPQGPLRDRGAFDHDAHAGRLSRDAAFFRDRFGASYHAARNESLPALVLACEDEHRVALGNVLAPIHRLLRSKRERLRSQTANLSFDRERHVYSRSVRSQDL